MRITEIKVPDFNPIAQPAWSPVSLLPGIERFYLVHIRKTAGTSLNHMFLSLGDSDHEAFHKALVENPDHRLERNGKVFVGWNEKIIATGDFFYAFSNAPFFGLNLPKGTFAFSVFRDPVSRVIAHYNMLVEKGKYEPDNPHLEAEFSWIEGGFEGFLEAVPKSILMNQLHAFSETFDIQQALDCIKRLDYFFFTERFEAGLEELNRKTGLNLMPIRRRVSLHRAQVAKQLVERLRERLEPEYQFLREAKNLLHEKPAVPDWTI